MQLKKIMVERIFGAQFVVFVALGACSTAEPGDSSLAEGEAPASGGDSPCCMGADSGSGGSGGDGSGGSGGDGSVAPAAGGADSATGGTAQGSGGEAGSGGGSEMATGGTGAAPTSIFVGGVSGIMSLAEPENTDTYREKGGGLYLHHSGWAPLSAAEKNSIEDVFADARVVVELGYKNNDLKSWQNAYKVHYHDRGMRPTFITLNAFSSDRVPDVAEFQDSVDAYRSLGVEESTHIFATFEYQNFPGRIPTLANNHVSVREDFQQIISISGGLVLDTPSIVFFRREQAYRNWVIDAIDWTHSQGLLVAIIFSPNNAKLNYDENTLDYLEYLAERDALPDLYAVENYSTDDPATYPNIVGSEDVPDHQVGCARMIQETAPSLGE